MTIETIRKKHPVDFACLYNDYVSTKQIKISLLIDFVSRFEFDDITREIEEVFFDNMSSYSDEFISIMTDYFSEKIKAIQKEIEPEIEMLKRENIELKRENEKLKITSNENKRLLELVLERLR